MDTKTLSRNEMIRRRQRAWWSRSGQDQGGSYLIVKPDLGDDGNEKVEKWRFHWRVEADYPGAYTLDSTWNDEGPPDW
jgi:hypothetical protein